MDLLQSRDDMLHVIFEVRYKGTLDGNRSVKQVLSFQHSESFTLAFSLTRLTSNMCETKQKAKAAHVSTAAAEKHDLEVKVNKQ